MTGTRKLSTIKTKVDGCDCLTLELKYPFHDLYFICFCVRAELMREENIKNSVKFTVTCNLLMSTLERVTDKGETGRILKEDSTAVTFKCLPAIVKGKID